MRNAKKLWIAVKTAWNYLDGKKTAIGTGLLLVSEVLPKYTTAYYVCYIGGTVLGGTGLLHKASKADAAALAIEGIKKVIKK